MLELKEIIRVLKSNLKLILLCTLAGGLFGLGFSQLMGVKYEASNTLYVKRETEPTSDNYYNYDGFYSQQTSKEYTETVLGLLKTIEPYREAAIRLDNRVDPKELFGSTKVRKTSAQVISLSVTRKNETEAKKSLSILVEGLVEKVKSLNQNGDKKLYVEPVRTEPFVITVSPRLILNITLGFLSGLLISLVSIALSSYFKEKVT